MTDKTITISTPNKLRVSGIQIKENTSIRNKVFTQSDLAYTCDIDAIKNKVNALNDFSHSNDEELSKKINNYILKNELLLQV